MTVFVVVCMFTAVRVVNSISAIYNKCFLCRCCCGVVGFTFVHSSVFVGVLVVALVACEKAGDCGNAEDINKLLHS